MNQFNPEVPPASRVFQGRPQPVYSTFVPFLIVLVTLIFSTTKDIYLVHNRKITVIIDNAKQGDALERAGEEATLVEKLHTDLNQLAPSDPAAARLLNEFFAQSSSSRKE